MMHDRTDHQVTYLVKRLTQAQGCAAWLGPGCGFGRDPQEILGHVRKQSRSAKGCRFTLRLARYFRSSPTERGSNVVVLLHLQNKDNWLTFDPQHSIEVQYTAGYDKNYRPLTETIPVEVVKSYRDTWMALLDAIASIRAMRRR